MCRKICFLSNSMRMNHLVQPVRLPCVESTAAEFCIKYGECPPGQSYTWEQQLCQTGHATHPAVPDSFDSMTIFELFHSDGDSLEARGLATRRLHAKLAPQVTENPICMQRA